MTATIGFGKRWIRALSRYSSCQNVRGNSASPAVDGGVQRDDVAARAEPALAGAVEQHVADFRLALEAVECRVDQANHLERERVDRRRAVERDVAERAFAFDEHGRGLRGGAHRACPTTPRAMISRMISFVPSTIWWTRRSRTIFSSPYSERYP